MLAETWWAESARRRAAAPRRHRPLAGGDREGGSCEQSGGVEYRQRRRVGIDEKWDLGADERHGVAALMPKAFDHSDVLLAGFVGEDAFD